MRSIAVLAVLCFHFVISSTAADDLTVAIPSFSENPKGNLTVLEGWQNFEKSLKNIVNSLVKTALPAMMESTGKMNLSQECMRNSMHLISGLKAMKPWAMGFLDSSAKMIDGVMVGTLSNFGIYDECINIQVKNTKLRDKGKVLYTGQYCSIHLSPPLPPKQKFYKLDSILPELRNFSQRDTAIAVASKNAHLFQFLHLQLGICVPSGCSLEDINKIGKLLGEQLSLSATASRCEVKEEKKYPSQVIAIMIAYSFAGALMCIGTFIDIYGHYRKIIYENVWIRVLTSFSLFTNFRKFANTETASDTLSCLNGMRFLGMTWIILGHTYFVANFQMVLGLEKATDFAKDFAFQAIVNASVAVDTFFCIGGLLVCYLTIKLCRIQGKKLNIGLYFFHRLWRILPVYVYVIMFMFLGDLMGSGPIWHDTTHKYLKACHDNWWTNLIFMNNFYDPQHMCIPQSWYIACDVQLYVAALLILIPMIRWPRVGLSLSVLGMITSIVYSGLATYINDFPPAMLFAHPDPEQREEYWARFYFKPFIHASPYCIGIITGYILATKPNLKIPPLIQVVGWCLAFICNFSVLYGVAGWNRGADITLLESILYSSLNRTAWTLGVAWMIVCCATGHGGIINYILSWKAFVPLGRLTYVAYLIHPVVQIIAVGNIRTLVQPDHFFAVWIYLGHLCVTFATAFAGSMLIESPFMALEKIIMPRPEKKTENSFLAKQNSILKGSLKSEKNGDIAVIVPNTDEESGGIDNTCVVYRL